MRVNPNFSEIKVSKTVLLTRPSGENEALAELLAVDGLLPIVEPMIKLVGKRTDAVTKKISSELDRYNKIIFVSKGAVRFGLPVLEDRWKKWPSALEWFSVGMGTAQELKGWGVFSRFPSDAGTEGLLELPSMKGVAGEQILIVRGKGGRELLGQSLIKAGASVTYLETYFRRLLPLDFSNLTAGTIVILTSAEILENFASLAGNRLSQFYAIVPSSRLVDLAKMRGFLGVANSSGASITALYDAVKAIVNAFGKVNE